MGTPDFSVTILKALEAANTDYEIAAVVTQPDKPAGRGKKLLAPPVKEYAIEKGFKVYQPINLKDEDWYAELELLNIDVAVVAAYGRILPVEILSLPTHGCVNVHASLLPAYRGAAPIQWAIRNRDKETGITLMQMDEHMDTGDILTQDKLKISGKETTGSLFEKLAVLGAKMIIRDLSGICEGSIVGVSQRHDQATYAPMFERRDKEIDWKNSAESIEALIRSYLPESGCYTYLNGKKLTFFKTNITEYVSQKTPGTIVKVTKESFLVQTGSVCLEILEVQHPGKKRVSCRDFLNGYILNEGDIFESKSEMER